MKSNKKLAELSDISFHYPDKNILSKASLTLSESEMISIVGKSGIGKSTLLYILGGFLKPSEGSYLFEDNHVYNFAEFGLGRFRKKNIGFVFQDFRLISFLTVKNNIRLPIMFSGNKFKKDTITNLLNKLGITSRANAKPTSISGGEAQRTAIGRALVMAPKLLLLDEPTGNLDQKTELEIISILQALKKEGLSIVCVTHSDKIMEASDIVYELESEKLVAKERPKFATRKKTITKKKIVKSQGKKKKVSRKK